MPQYILTYRDLLDQLNDSQGGTPDGVDDRLLRRAIQEAYRQIASDHLWTYLFKEGQIITLAPYTTGTVVYTHSTKTVTGTGTTFPTDSALCKIRIGNTVSIVKSRTSATALVLDDNVNPGEDVAASSYTIFRSEYNLPLDFVKMTEPMQEASWWGARYIRPDQFLMLERYGSGTGTPQAWTIIGDSNYYSGMAIAFYPAPDSADTLKFLYFRRPRQLRFDGYQTGVTQGTATTGASATVTGTSTAFSADHIGSIIRVSSSLVAPTGLDGTTPYSEEGRITAAASATSLTVSTAFTNTNTAKSYNISDPVDIDEVMMTPFRYLVEKWLAFFRRDEKAMRIAGGLYERELLRAAAADQRNISRKMAGRNYGYSNRLANWPGAADDTYD
jgi:hypothetical protein